MAGESRFEERGRSEVWLADLVRALHRLAPDDEAAGAMLTLLGFDPFLQVARPRAPGAFMNELGSVPPPAARMPPGDTGPTTRVDQTDLLPVLPAVVESLSGASAGAAPSWLSDPTIEPLKSAADAPTVPAQRHEPLFLPQEQRAILAATLATATNEGDIDVDRLVTLRAEMRPFVGLLRARSATLRRGVQLLLDESEGFVPYAADRDEIARAIEMVVGTPQVATFGFTGSPERGLTSAQSEGAWFPPAPGTVIACVTDLGIGGRKTSPDRGSVAEWKRFADRATTAGCPVVAFVPFGPGEWPPDLARAIRLVHWDRTTSSRDIRRVFGRGHQTGR